MSSSDGHHRRQRHRCGIGFLVGDVNQNRVVTVADLGLVNAQLAQS